MRIAPVGYLVVAMLALGISLPTTANAAAGDSLLVKEGGKEGLRLRDASNRLEFSDSEMSARLACRIFEGAQGEIGSFRGDMSVTGSVALVGDTYEVSSVYTFSMSDSSGQSLGREGSSEKFTYNKDGECIGYESWDDDGSYERGVVESQTALPDAAFPGESGPAGCTYRIVERTGSEQVQVESARWRVYRDGGSLALEQTASFGTGTERGVAGFVWVLNKAGTELDLSKFHLSGTSKMDDGTIREMVCESKAVSYRRTGKPVAIQASAGPERSGDLLAKQGEKGRTSNPLAWLFVATLITLPVIVLVVTVHIWTAGSRQPQPSSPQRGISEAGSALANGSVTSKLATPAEAKIEVESGAPEGVVIDGGLGATDSETVTRAAAASPPAPQVNFVPIVAAREAGSAIWSLAKSFILLGCLVGGYKLIETNPNISDLRQHIGAGIDDKFGNTPFNGVLTNLYQIRRTNLLFGSIFQISLPNTQGISIRFCVVGIAGRYFQCPWDETR